MNDTRYTPPGAPVRDIAADAQAEDAAVPPKVLAQIRGAWLACLVWAAVTLFQSLAAMVQDAADAPLGLVDVACILALAFGISRKSRICAVVMLVYFVSSKYLVYQSSGHLGAWWWAIVLLVLYAQGIAGTFEFRRLRKA